MGPRTAKTYPVAPVFAGQKPTAMSSSVSSTELAKQAMKCRRLLSLHADSLGSPVVPDVTMTYRAALASRSL
jgi:hypothetical protein